MAALAIALKSSSTPTALVKQAKCTKRRWGQERQEKKKTPPNNDVRTATTNRVAMVAWYGTKRKSKSRAGVLEQEQGQEQKQDS